MAEADGKAGCGRQGALAVGLSQPAGWRSLLSITILFLAWLAGFSSRLFAVIRFESVIHEFDPCTSGNLTAKVVEFDILPDCGFNSVCDPSVLSSPSLDVPRVQVQLLIHRLCGALLSDCRVQAGRKAAGITPSHSVA
ncbi:hypothetical protein AOLI_G00189020 [Acnodon oligacanthus]